MEPRPGLAVLTTPLRVPTGEQWNSSSARQRSQPPPDRRESQRTRKSSSNRIKARPANPQVISSIISSFEALTPPSSVGIDDFHHSDTGSKGSGSNSAPAHSSDGATVNMPAKLASPASSPGFGVEYGSQTALPEEIEDDDDDADATNVAPPPSVRTSRPPSGLSNYVAPLSSHANGHSHGPPWPPSLNSRTNSFTGQGRERDTGPRNKLSAESWVKQSPGSQDSLEVAKAKKSGRRSLRRIPSQETLKSALQLEDITTAPVTGGADLSVLSRAEQIIARTPPALADQTKGRLYLSDTNPYDEQAAGDPVAESPMPSGNASEADTGTLSDARTLASERTTPLRISPKKSPIVDSIPTRTSSLRQSSNSPNRGKRKDKKAKGQTAASTKTDGVVDESAEFIPESSWADLGENDETVRRIRELREKRKSRLEESAKSFPVPASLAAEERGAEPKARQGEDTGLSSRTRPAAKRVSTEPNSKARKVLGISEDAPIQELKGTVINWVGRNSSNSPNRTRRPPPPAVMNGQYAGGNRPSSASSLTPPLSLEYSYAQAVDALQGADRDLQRRDAPPSRPTSVTSTPKYSTALQNTRFLQGLDLSAPLVSDAQSSPSTRAVITGQRTKSKRRAGYPQDRQKHHHPDLPLEFDKKKSRRKSMSDARHPRVPDEALNELPRRDSIEDAVIDYLRAPRLTRKARHPLTGRSVAYSEVGDPDGAAVFICVGMGLTRYVTAFYDELAATLRLRLITIDRPGVGGSEPFPPGDKSGPLSWPDDVLTICQHLGVTKFSMLAHSAGAIYALATALILPHMIKGKVHLLAPWIPPSQLEAIPHPTSTAPPGGSLPRGQRILRVLPASFLKAANSSFMTATSASLKPASRREIQAARMQQRQESQSPTPSPVRPSTRDRSDHHRRESMMLMDQYMPTTIPLDSFRIPSIEAQDEGPQMPNPNLFLSATATPTDPNFTFASTALNAAEHAEKERKIEYTSRLTQRTWELATKDSNPATDLLVCLERHRDVGFKYTDVTHDVVITHGSEDKRVPMSNVKWLADQMNARALAGVASENVPQTKAKRAEGALQKGGCTVRILRGEGHGLMASAPIMSDILTEISEYWAGQEKGRATL